MAREGQTDTRTRRDSHRNTRRGRLIAHAPNALSSLRIALAIALPIAAPAARLPIVLIAGATDFLDGVIARRFAATSALGGMLDAVADKLFTLSAIGTLLLAGEIVWWQAAVALARDAAVAGAAVVAAARGRLSRFVGLSPSRAGKWTTAFFFLWFTVELARAPTWAGWAAFIPAGAFSVLAAGDYLKKLVVALRDDEGLARTRDPG